jgi:CBS domain-containing protein
MLCAKRLLREHELIGGVLSAVGGAIAPGGSGLGPAVFQGAIEFFDAFIGRCHEAKEEQVLLPMLRERGQLDSATVQRLARDHAEGARLLQGLRAASRPPAADADAEALALLAAYGDLQRRHMAFEDTAVLGPAAALPADEDRRLQGEFDRVDERVVGRGGHDVLVALGGALVQACHALRPVQPPAVAATARDVMRAAPAPLGADDSLARALEQMDALDRRELPVVDGGQLAGILTRSDIEPYRGHLEWTIVRNAMSRDPLTVAPDTSLRTLAAILIDHDLNGVPVVEDGRVVGLVRRSDLLRELVRRLEH